MIPGPNYIYQCPSCNHFLFKESVASGNTFDAILYSDGKQVAPMLPDFPSITRCSTCSKVLWLHKLKPVNTCEPELMGSSEWRAATKAQFAKIEDLFRALSDKLAENRDEEIFIRQQIVWTFNDRVRAGEPLFQSEKDEQLWNQNTQDLIQLLDQSDINELILMAELHRYLGNFQECSKLINSIAIEELDWLKEKITRECLDGNRNVTEVS